MNYLSLFFMLFTVNLLFLNCQNSETASEREPSKKIRVILDTDANNELDDQHAIAYMLFNGDVFNVEGITVNKTKNGGSIHQHFAEAERVWKLW